MRTLLVFGTLVSLLSRRPSESLAQEEKLSFSPSSHEFSGPDQDRPWVGEARRDPAVGSRDLWYGTPGVRSGGDLLGPILELVKRPSGLLDLQPRKVSSDLPDQETAEFLRERR